MRFIVISAFMLGILHLPVGVHCLLAQQADQSSHVATVEAAIQDLISTLVAASNANDVKAFASVFAEDADFTNVIGQHVKEPVGAHRRFAVEPALQGQSTKRACLIKRN